ncbi:acetylornithinedeacetylase/succinyl-diaminopimelate desuccinylase [Fructobacillus pseudoficulneus]|uniref:Acetylornithinedeacetylase/succinyl-diaminopimelate desuccinylase n=1 Tax=Fructobacillus pseudoficulneus TaxID=220714 RepID=A0A3F3GVW3_9LACO|nr:M20/M25/M40 family metallo-hydrolase [Fructobacillus pseudoficulneus]GAP02946.1 acetylornithinedeacetylase/succinyl-diaminopimelate desuccinylase [Fructobacillus pseudoficulneus]SEH44911.1 succinyl-diaminopimelate desuccinylase [Fructobacillus pseudoficulneus]
MTNRKEEYLDLLNELIALPSVSAKHDSLPETAQVLGNALTKLGGKVTIDDSYFAPLVIGQFDSDQADAKNLIIYNHYDVQPAEPFDLWEQDPWTLTEKDGHLIGRGVDDDKGNITARLTALAEYLDENQGKLPVNITFLFEGSEETASQHLDDYLAKHPELKADLIIWESGNKDDQGQIELGGGTKGIVTFDVTAKTGKIDLHSSLAVVADSAAWRLSQGLATLFDPKTGKIQVPGFYDDVVVPNQREKDLVNALPGTKEDFIKGYQITAPLLSDKRGVDWKEALYFEPSINIEGISAGYEEAGVKTVLPAEAHAKLEARLVPGMDPDKTLQQIKDYLADQGFGDLIVEKTLGQPGYRSDMSDPEIIKVINLAKELYPGEPVVSPTSPGTGPMAYVNNAIKAPIISLGVGYQGALDHAPNENIRLTDYEDNIKFVKLIIGSYAN